MTPRITTTQVAMTMRAPWTEVFRATSTAAATATMVARFPSTATTMVRYSAAVRCSRGR